MVFIASPRPTCLGIFFLPPELQDTIYWPIAKIFLVSFSFRTLSFKSLWSSMGSPSPSSALWDCNNHLKNCWSLAGTASVTCKLGFSGCVSNPVAPFILLRRIMAAWYSTWAQVSAAAGAFRESFVASVSSATRLMISARFSEELPTISDLFLSYCWWNCTFSP